MEKSFDFFGSLTETQKKQGKIRGLISATIENKRYSLGLSQKKFAELLGVTQGMVSKLESSEYNMTTDKLVEVFEKLELDYDIVINGVECASRKKAEYKDHPYSNQNNNWNIELKGLVYIFDKESAIA